MQPVRIVTAASLFDGHDAAINIMRRRLAAHGAEIIHLGHDRSAAEIAKTAKEEDAHGVALTSYQGGHIEYFTYIRQLLDADGLQHIPIFAGGGGTILPEEIAELAEKKIAKIYTPDDGRAMGLDGMILDVLQNCNASVDIQIERATSARQKFLIDKTIPDDTSLSSLISSAELESLPTEELEALAAEKNHDCVILGLTGPGGAGKSSLLDELTLRFLNDPNFTDFKAAVLCVDPTKRKGGALLGDRLRINTASHERVFFRSLATRRSSASLSAALKDSIALCRLAGFKMVLVESSGTGQSDSDIIDFCESNIYVMTPEYGAATQLEKTDMLEFADFIAINKSDRAGAEDAHRDVSRLYRRLHDEYTIEEQDLPVFNTISSRFKDSGTDRLFEKLKSELFLFLNKDQLTSQSKNYPQPDFKLYHSQIIPPARVRYLSEINEVIQKDEAQIKRDAELYREIEALQITGDLLPKAKDELFSIIMNKQNEVSAGSKRTLERWEQLKPEYEKDALTYHVRGKEIKTALVAESLSENKIRRVELPKTTSKSELIKFLRKENLPGEYPYTAGVFPLKRKNEDPTRMFAGEGAPERTNRRFHYLSHNQPATRLSTAFDSVTLYGRDAAVRPDIYGKIGNAGVSICSLDDMKKLYSGFDLCDPNTSVSMTINGPAAAVSAFFLNAAIDQQIELHLANNGKLQEAAATIKKHYESAGLSVPAYAMQMPQEHNQLGLTLLGMPGNHLVSEEVYHKIAKETVAKVRATVQADILKEDQAQNTCIFSTEFSLRLMADQQQWFIDNNVKNFYSVSISGYHMAEAGANPITQLAFTLANGFTYVEYYRSRGMDINEFAPNFSFFFSNGLDPEYTVIGRVARRIWARAMHLLYGTDERSQKLKYHIQTSGRSLHAQEIDFNDIRTTIQAFYALADNCNSLHTNAYDEAITTPTEDSVRRAVAIQMILNRESGILKNENPMQGSYFIEALTDLVEQKVLEEFDRLTNRGGVMGAMERGYQRGKIQDESHKYESLKNSGELPIVGVNTFLSSTGSPSQMPPEVFRSTDEEKKRQIDNVKVFNAAFQTEAEQSLSQLKTALHSGTNSFEALMSAVRYNSLGKITEMMFEAGGRYRRNM